jgi:hypothetical protein
VAVLVVVCGGVAARDAVAGCDAVPARNAVAVCDVVAAGEAVAWRGLGRSGRNHKRQRNTC